MRWTDDQAAAIETTGCSLLVSAAAGSGKTAVLAERCARLVSEWIAAGSPEEASRCGVENLLVVTFTNAAAAQMRARIGEALTKKAAAAEEARDSRCAECLRREVLLLPRASISTLSSFCSHLVRRHFHAAGVDPNFAVLDEDQARLMKLKAAREVIEEAFEREERLAREHEGAGEDGPAARPIADLIDLWGDGRDTAIVSRLIACHELLTSVADPRQWLADAGRTATLGGEGDDAALPAGIADKLDQLVARELDAISNRMRRTLKQCEEAAAEEQALQQYVPCCREMLARVDGLREMLRDRGRSGVREALAEFEWPKLPTIRGDFARKEACRKAIGACRAALRSSAAKPSRLEQLVVSDADWLTGIRTCAAAIASFVGLLTAFGCRYAQLKDRARALDFADLERKSFDLLRQGDATDADRLAPSPIALHYQKRFAHLLVDEFQDINELQDRILRLLSRETAPPEANASFNLFAVGDVKQSIYRFRLAEPEQFMDRLRGSGPVDGGDSRRRIDLQQNFRSRAPLLTAINAAFMRLMRDDDLLEIDYDDRHGLVGWEDYPALPEGGFAGGPVEIVVLDAPGSGQAPDADGDGDGGEGGDAGEGDGDAPEEYERIEREAVIVAGRLRQWRDEGRQVVGESGEPEPFDFRHAAVLMRAFRRQSERFARALRRLGVPCHSETGTGFFDAIEVGDIVSLLQVLDNRRQDIPLAAVLRSPLLSGLLTGAGDDDDAGLGLGATSAGKTVDDALARIRAASRRSFPFFRAVEDYARRDGDYPLAERLREVLAGIDRWRTAAQRRPVAELLWDIYQRSGYLAYVAGLPEGQQRVANLLEVHRRAAQYDQFFHDGLGGFLEFLDSLKESASLGQPPVALPQENVVRVMSVHAAKGLEFPVVFLVDCGKEHNTQDEKAQILLDREIGVGPRAVDRQRQVRYPSLPHELIRGRIRQRSRAEELRILYVAMTRAREHLVCVGSAGRRGTAGDMIDEWESWAGSEAIDPVAVLEGRHLLDWLGMASAGNGEHFAVEQVPDGEVTGALEAARTRAVGEEVPREILALKEGAVASAGPTGPTRPEAATEAAAEVAARLAWSYPHAEAATRPAAMGVTRLVEGAGEGATQRQSPAATKTVEGPTPASPKPATRNPQLELLPPAFAMSRRFAAVEIGTATHEVLRLLDFNDASDARAVSRQITAMADRGLIDAALLEEVDPETLAWVAGSALGEMIRAAGETGVWRELPLRVGLEEGPRPGDEAAERPREAKATNPEAGDPQPDAGNSLDRTLLRGTVDVLLDAADAGLILADYKTDGLPAGVSPDDFAATKAAGYAPQLRLYARALERITGRPVTRGMLALLSIRRLVDVPL